MTVPIAESNPIQGVDTPKILLLGLGNDLLTDDAIGLRVVASIQDALKAHPNICVVGSSEMGLALLDLVIGFQTVVIVDAIQTNTAPPGFIHELENGDLPNLPSISPHFLGVAELLALGRELGLDVPGRVKIFAIEVDDPFTIGTRLTPILSALLPQIIERVLDFCEFVAGDLAPEYPRRHPLAYEK